MMSVPGHALLSCPVYSRWPNTPYSLPGWRARFFSGGIPRDGMPKSIALFQARQVAAGLAAKPVDIRGTKPRGRKTAPRHSVVGLVKAPQMTIAQLRAFTGDVD